MSGSYETVNQGAPGGLDETAAAVQAGVASAQAAVAARQVDAGRFIVENGSAVVAGHADVGNPQD